MSQLDDFTRDLGAMLGLVCIAAIPIGIVILFWFGQWGIATGILCGIGLLLWANEAASRMPK